MSKSEDNAIADAIREAGRLILAGLCAIGEAIHESKEEPELEEAKPPARECVGIKPALGYGGLCASLTCLDPPKHAGSEATDEQGERWHLCTGCVEHMMQHGYELSVVKRKGIPPKPDMASVVRLRRKAEEAS